MKFTIRDVFWSATVVALIAAWLVDSRQQRTMIRFRDERTQEAERQLSIQQRRAQLYAARAEQTQLNQHSEILKLRQLLKRSINDQRDWFELETSTNRILAISPATANGADVTLRTIRHAEAATGLDASKLRHFMEPIRELQLRSGSVKVQKPDPAHRRR